MVTLKWLGYVRFQLNIVVDDNQDGVIKVTHKDNDYCIIKFTV